MDIDSRPAVIFSEFLNLYLVGDGINCPSIGGISDSDFTSPVSCSNLINEQITSSSSSIDSHNY